MITLSKMIKQLRIQLAEHLLYIIIDTMPDCKEKKTLEILLIDYLLEVSEKDNGKK